MGQRYERWIYGQPLIYPPFRVKCKILEEMMVDQVADNLRILINDFIMECLVQDIKQGSLEIARALGPIVEVG